MVLSWGLFYLYDNPKRQRIANFCNERMYRRGETKQVAVSKFTPINGVNSDTLQNPHRNAYRQFSRFLKLLNMAIGVGFYVRDRSRGHEKSTLKSL